MNILVVEDNLDAAESLRDILEMEGHSVVLAQSGEEGLRAHQPGRFALMLVDLKIPGMGGKALIQQILLKEPKARIFVLTGNSVKEEIEEVQRLPVLQVIRKPYDPAVLVGLLRQLSDSIG